MADVLVEDYLHSLTVSTGFAKLKANFLSHHAETWHKFYYVLYGTQVPGAKFAGPGLAVYANNKYLEGNDLCLDCIPLHKKCKVVLYERNCFARVKNAYHFGLVVPGKDTIVLETTTDQARLDWFLKIMKLGCVDGGHVNAKKIKSKSVKEGYLCKIGKQEKTSGFQGGWRIRFFVLALNPTRLDYFKTSYDATKNNTKRTVLLDDSVVVYAMQDRYLGYDYTFCIDLGNNNSRRLVVSAHDEADMMAWIAEIQKMKAYEPTLSRAATEKQKRHAQSEQEHKVEQDRAVQHKRQAKYFKKQMEALEEERLKQKLDDEKMFEQIEQEKNNITIERRSIQQHRSTFRSDCHKIADELVEQRKRKAELLEQKELLLGYLDKAQSAYNKEEEAHSVVMDVCQQIVADDEDLMERENNLFQREQAVTVREQENRLKDLAVDEFTGVMKDAL